MNTSPPCGRRSVGSMGAQFEPNEHHSPLGRIVPQHWGCSFSQKTGVGSGNEGRLVPSPCPISFGRHRQTTDRQSANHSFPRQVLLRRLSSSATIFSKAPRKRQLHLDTHCRHAIIALFAHLADWGLPPPRASYRFDEQPRLLTSGFGRAFVGRPGTCRDTKFGTLPSRRETETSHETQ